MENSTATIEVQAHEANHQGNVSILSPDVSMVILTWVTFFLLLAILYKFAWKPILDALEKREQEIRKALEHADEARQQLAEINQSREKIVSEAHQKAQEVVEQSRKAALELAKVIQDKARQENQILLENAKREIDTEKQKAQFALRRESAELAVSLAAKVIQEKMDKEQSRKIVDDLIKNI